MNRLPLIGLALTLGLAAFGDPSRARAQAADILSGIQNQPLEYPRGRALDTVMERDQPLYDPQPYHFGTLELMPRLTADARYDSNIYARRHATGDAILSFEPRIDATDTIGDLTVKLSGDVDREQYLAHSSQSTTDFTVGSSVRYDPSRDTSLYVGSRLGLASESLTDPSAPINAQRPIRYGLASVFLGGSRSFDRLRIAGRLGAERRSYHDGRDATGAVIDESFRSRVEWSADMAAEFALTPDTSFFVEGNLNRHDYDAASVTEPPRDSRGYRIEGGANFAVTHLIRGQLGIGYFSQNFRSPVFPDAHGLAVHGKLEYLVTPLVTVTLTGDRGVEEASTPSVGAYVATKAGLRADYELLRNVIISASAGYERDAFKGVDRRYSVQHDRIGAIYKLSPRMWLHADYDYRDQMSSGSFPGRVFSRHQLMLGITFQGG